MKRISRHTLKALFRSPLVWVVILARLCGILLILWFPLAGMLISFVFDWVDAAVIIHGARYSREEYHAIDKSVDHVWSAVMLVVAWQTPYRMALLILFFWRIFGYIVYLYTDNTQVYIWFPNVFEFVFFWAIALSPALGEPYRSAPLAGVIAISLFFKEIQEYALHVWWAGRVKQYRRTGYPKLLRRFGMRYVG